MENKKKIILTLFSNTLIIVFLTFISIFLTILFGYIFKYDFVMPLIYEVIISILILLSKVCIIKFMELIRTINRKEYFYSKSYDDKEIRLSFAYLIRIKVNNRYLLVRSNSRKKLFQPVGGVYHIDNPIEIKNKMGFYRDGTPGDSNDIRGNIKGKRIKKFIKWFNNNKQRECGPYREFKEEMINTNIFPIDIFNDANLKFVYCDYFYKGIYQDEFYNIKSLLRFDIYEMVLTEEQLNYIVNLKHRNIKLASYEEIETLGVTKDNDERLFGTQTPYILENYRKKENTNE